MPTNSVTATISLSELCFPDLTGKTLQAWGQVVFSPGAYTFGGIPMGLIAYADARTVDFQGFLRCSVYTEDVLTPTVGGYSFHYSPIGDVLQITYGGVELAQGTAIPANILNDTVLFLAVWNRTTVLG